MRELIRDRWTLLRLLVATGVGATAALAAVMIGVTLLPAATAAATGALVGSIVGVSEQGAALASIVPNLVAVGVLLVVDLTAQSLLMPIRDHAAMRVNGVIRERVRQHVGRPASIDHLEDQRVRKLSSLAVQDRYLFNIGAAAEGELWLIARLVGALGSAALLATYSSLLALLSLAVLLAQRAILRRQYATAVGRVIDEAVAAERAASYWQQVTTTLKGAKEIRLFGFDEWAAGKYMAPLTKLARIEIDRLARALPRQWITFVLSGLALGVPFVALTRGALSGDVSTGQFALLLGAAVGLTPIGTMGYEAFSIEAATSQLQALRELSTLPAEPGGAATTHSVAPRIAFEGVSFRYPGQPDSVLYDLDLVIEPGESLAIVGENGAGKTTLLKLLGALHRPTSGRILVDGADLQDIDPSDWRQRLAVVFQDFVHYQLPARDNVALGTEGSTDIDGALQTAADAAGAGELVGSLPLGWSTILSPGYRDGVELSGGQWQRIALARALFAANAGATVIALDEPTANLDVHAETELFDRFLSSARGSSMIVVSHRFSTVRRAHRIVVIDNGRVIEDGDHPTLLAANGAYARLYRLQADRFGPEQAAPGETS